MNIINHTLSVSISRILKDLGVLQQSFFYHWFDGEEYLGCQYNDAYSVGEYTERISAFTLSELHQMGIPSDKNIIDLLAMDLAYSLQNNLVKLSEVNINIANN